MQYEFSIGSFFIGLLILLAGAAFVRWYQWVADNFGSGVVSYDRYRLVALLTCVLGLIVMINLHTTTLVLLFDAIFPG